jgi:hypothetical protein
VEEPQPVQPFLDRQHVLPAHDEAGPAFLPSAGNVVRRFHQPPRAARLRQPLQPFRKLVDGLAQVGQGIDDGQIDGAEPARDQIGRVSVAIEYEPVYNRRSSVMPHRTLSLAVAP